MTTKKLSNRQRTFREAVRASQRERLLRRAARQKKALRALVGIAASGFTDISSEYDKYLHEKS